MRKVTAVGQMSLKLVIAVLLLFVGALVNDIRSDIRNIITIVALIMIGLYRVVQALIVLKRVFDQPFTISDMV